MKSRKILFGLIAMALAAGVWLLPDNNAEADGIKLGAKAPMADAKMKGVDGKMYSIAGIQGDKGTLVIFSCNSCPWVKRWENRIATIGNAYQQKGIGVIVINSNDPDRIPEDGYAEMVKRANDKGFEFPYVVDGTSDVAREFGATHTPEAFLFNASGNLVYHGAIDDNAPDANAVESPYLKDALNAVIAGKSVPMAETKALGCTIKFRNSDS